MHASPSLAMYSVTSSSSKECDSHAPGSQPPHMPTYGGFLQPNPQPIIFSDHLMMVAESNQLMGAPKSSNPDYLNVLVNDSPSAHQPLGFTDQSLNVDASFFRNPARLLVTENAAQGPVDQSAMTVESTMSSKASRRNRKKRTRALRKPQTTVMMTDTANFRAMVQEFTGIPATSLAAPSYNHRARVESIWPNGSGLGCNLEPHLAYWGLPMRTFTPNAKSSLGLLGFQSFAKLQDLGTVMDLSRRGSQNAPDKYPMRWLQ
ncbi:hypothetical protein SAY87_028017 [Trapa incisa]|uniref:VQ domain-containing protein n=1 Tax=Trapa incisa TaxID=236973 RepID=A0AAN7QR86_9MYRT|nr:hypothetical protein SAY87_028017 [Trapa incisa]